MLALEKYKEAWFQEIEYGSGRYLGVKILVANGQEEPSEEVKRIARHAAEEMEYELECLHWANDPDVIARRVAQRQELIALFQGRDIFVEEIENGYSTQDPWYKQFPWYRVTTSKGIITLGWRKRVVSIDWDGTNGNKTMRSCKELFPDEDVTKMDGPNQYSGSIHAWGLEKAQEYITRILT